MNRKLLFYRISAFISGMSVMAVELAASRLLAPYFSSSILVWSVIIGTIMASMSLGNYCGGWLADRAAGKGTDAPIYTRILIAGVWIACIPLAGKYVIAAVSGIAIVIAGSQLLVVGSLLACLIIFAAPMVLLGMVSPFLVRFAIDADEQNPGRATGSIYAWGTVGSIIGTFLPSFVTIPLLGVSRTFLLFALLLALLVLIYGSMKKTRWWPGALVSAICLALLLVPQQPHYAFWKNNIVYEGESVYNYLQVTQDDQYRYFSTNVMFGVQSMIPRELLRGENAGIGTDTYFHGLLGACGFLPDFAAHKPIDALVLGLGAGTYPIMLRYTLPGSTCVGVEIDPAIVKLAADYFGLTAQDCVAVVGDGRTYVQRDNKKYDVIVIDAYQDISIPFYMATTEFFGLCKDRLKPGGVLVCNINMNTRENGAVVNALTATLQSRFSAVYAYNVGTNTLLYAPTGGGLELFTQNVAQSAANRPLYQMLRATGNGLTQISGDGPVLTDNRAPTEILAASVLQNMISEQDAAVKSQVDAYGGGLSGWRQYLTELMK
ncbi:MAG: fused MFS/spermidine synthase [Firmicutes bacterium]|nr:fused MFS/spermidine synthase [Bacillota bacterium]